MGFNNKPVIEAYIPPTPSCPVCHEELRANYYTAGNRLLSLVGVCRCTGKDVEYPDWVQDVYGSQVTKPAPQYIDMAPCEKCGQRIYHLHRWDNVKAWESATGICGCSPRMSYAEIDIYWKENSGLQRMLMAKKAIARYEEEELADTVS